MGNYSIYVIDHARKSIYTAVYIQNRQLLENVNLVITQFIARQSPENLLIPSSLQYAESDIEELQKTAAAEYRLYFIHHSDVHELSLQNKIIINARVVTAQFKLLPPQKMLLNEFVALAINDKIPVRLQQRNNFPSENTTISIHYSDAECTHNYVCAVSDKDQFTLRTLAKLYLKQPNVFKTLSKRSAQEFEDIAYLELKALLGEQLLDFFNNIEVGNAYSFFKEFIKEQLLVHSRDCYFDFSPLEMLDYSTIDFAINHPLDHEHFEGEYRGIEEAHALDRNVTINAQARALLSMQENPEAAEVQRKVLRDFIIDNFYDGSIGARDCSFPLPRADQWPQQVFVIECIQFLQRHINTIEKFAKYFFTFSLNAAEIINQHLFPLQVKREEQMRDLPFKLPISNDDEDVNYRYSIKLTDGSFLRWSSRLIYYIKFYNVVPTKDFLDKLKQCRLLIEKHYQAVVVFLTTFRQVPMLRNCLASLPDQFVEKIYQYPAAPENSEAINEIIHSAFALELAHRINDSINAQSIIQFETLRETIQNELKESLDSLFQLLDSIEPDSTWYPQAQMLCAEVLNRIINSQKLSEYICTLYEQRITHLLLNNPLNPQDKIKVLAVLAYANAGTEGKTLLAKTLADVLWRKATAETKLVAIEEATKINAPSLAARNYPRPFIEEARPKEISPPSASQPSLPAGRIEDEKAKVTPAP